jgi:hypothetical protein
MNCSVLFEVQIKFLNIIKMSFGFKGLNNLCRYTNFCYFCPYYLSQGHQFCLSDAPISSINYPHIKTQEPLNSFS